MRILYALQGTGNGHLARAQKILPILEEYGDLDVFVSGSNSQLQLENYQFKHHKGLSLFYNQVGKVSYKKILKENSFKSFWKEVNHFPIEQYDLIINDFEPITAHSARKKKKIIIGLSHQASLLFDETPKVKNKTGETILKYYAPTTKQYGFHFEAYNDSIFLPIIRDKIRMLNPKVEDYYLVYLPSFHPSEIIEKLSFIKDSKWKVFSPFMRQISKQFNVEIYPIDERLFTKALENCKGILCGAGFELPAESIYLKKKLFVIPIKGQYEQLCNCVALKRLEVDYSYDLNIEKLQRWVDSSKIIDIYFPDQTEKIIQNVMLEAII
ncbi:glycosyltransferase family protein [Empedobacter stercoris]|uniref:glycosyltransferase family protein n=1 Tax=Empedobacter stercoris TaxID=1628248 RepID=UPI001CE0956E|nr:glycosyltransferase family protein [Empedobacter stercoris]MCA4776587.1 glycosyl transferase [Empedobacter stercoris]